MHSGGIGPRILNLDTRLRHFAIHSLSSFAGWAPEPV